MRSSPSFCDTYFLTHCKSANGITRPPSRLTTKVRPACAPAYVPLSSIAHGRLQRMLGDITASTRHNIFLAPTARPCTGRFKLNQARASGAQPASPATASPTRNGPPHASSAPLSRLSSATHLNHLAAASHPGKPLICLSTFPLITNPHYNRFVDHDTSEEAIAQSGYLGLLN